MIPSTDMLIFKQGLRRPPAERSELMSMLKLFAVEAPKHRAWERGQGQRSIQQKRSSLQARPDLFL